MPQQPAEIARAALYRLIELELPPTPENYAKYYAQAAHASPPPDGATAPLNVQLIELINELVAGVTDTTAGLAEHLGEHKGRILQSADDLSASDDKDELLSVLSSIIATTNAIHGKVDSTHKDLVSSKRALQHIKTELQETRKWLQEDALTGAQNRRGMDVVLAREVARARRHGSRLSVAMLDMDHFKQINDTYGHDTGDRLLLHFTTVTKAVLRESDVLVRYGGEEFLVILPETDVNGASFMVGRLRAVVANSPMVSGTQRIGLTFSSGIAQLAPEENAHAMLMRADAALYAAKQAGRNCDQVA